MKKLNKFFAILVSLAMMATLCVSMAFATDQGTPASSEEQVNDAKLIKILKIADNVAAPTVTFNFNIAAQDTSYTITEANPEYDESDADSQETITRTITGRSATEAGQALKTTTFTMTADQNAKGSSKYGVKQLSTLFGEFPGAGIYTYKITETKSSLTPIADAKVSEKVNDNVNGDEYTIRVYVKADGTYTMTITDKDGKKVIPTDPTAGEVDPDNPTGMNFVNTYEKTIKTDPNDPDSVKNGVLNIKKTVEGDLADTTQQFPFELTLTRASTDTTEGNTVTATIVRVKGSKATETTKTITYDSPASFTLAANEYLKFDQLPAGTKYQVTEKLTTATATNKASYQASSGAVTAEKGADLELAQATLTEAAGVTVNNKLDDSDVTPTGILMNNLPYIVLALVAIGGLVAYVVVRRRQSDEA